MNRDEIMKNSSPELSSELKNAIKTTRRFSADMIIMMMVPAVMAWYYYGGRTIRLMVFSILTAVLCEGLGSKILKIKSSLSDFSAIATGLAIALCLPASSPYWLPCLASAFAIIVAKLPFGNSRSQMFSPAAAGIAFVTICMPEIVFGYPAILSSGSVGVINGEGFFSGTSLAYMLSQKNSIGVNLMSYVDVLVGNVAGPMGTTCAFAMFGALVYLLIRHPKNFAVAFSFIAVCFLYAIIFPRVLTGRLVSGFMEICGGTLLFSAIFLMSDESILPSGFYARICYGITAGLFCMIMRTVGKFEDSAVFAVLLANGLVTAFNKLPLTNREKKQLSAERAKQRAKLTDELTNARPNENVIEGGEQNG